MATLTDFTSYNEVMAVLGADTTEFPEANFDYRDLWLELEQDMEGWLPAEVSIDQILLAAEDSGDQTNADQKMVYLKAYSRYFCAWLISLSADLLFAERISDGQNEIQRSKRTDYSKLSDRLLGRAEKFKNLLLVLIDPTLSQSRRTSALFSTVSPSYDPVYNENT